MAATLLFNGFTVHSLFKLPLTINETTTSGIALNSSRAKLIEKAKIIIWDEAPMAPLHALNAVDRILRKIMKNENLPFGGKVVLLGGDFRQVTPVISHASKTKIIENSIKSSLIWNSFKIMKLTINMRTGISEIVYSKWLLKLGDGNLKVIINIT